MGQAKVTPLSGADTSGEVNGLSRDAIEALPVAVCMTDTEGHLTFYNEAAAALWGCRPELGETEFCSSWKLYSPDGTLLPHDPRAVAMALRQRRSICGMEVVAERPDGARISFISYPTPLFDESRRLTGAVNILVDISERKRTEAELAERQAQLAVFVEHTPASIAVFDRDMRYLAVSRRFLTDYRLPPDAQLTGGSHYEVFPEIPQRWRDRHARVLAGEEVLNEEDRFTRQDGRTDWVRWSMTPWRGGDGRIGGAVLFAEVRTEQVEARRAREKAEQALAERDLQLALTAKVGLVGTFAYDAHAEVMQIFDGYAAIHGFPEGTSEIPRSEWLAGVHPDDIGRVEQFRTEAFRERRRDYNVDYRFIRPGGELRWVEMRCFISFGEGGDPQRVVGVSIDVTERKRVEDHERTLLAELDHRVKNVLATVQAVAAHTMQASSSMEHFAAALDGRIRSMGSTHELLSYRRWLGIPLGELVERELAPYATGSNTKVDGLDVMLSAEAGQTMAMVFHELATNAAKHGALSMPQGRVSVRSDWCSNGDLTATLVLEWHEQSGPLVTVPAEQGYGISVIRDLIPYELNGTVDLEFACDGVRCTVAIPGEHAQHGPGGEFGSSARTGSFLI